ncbi:hypothetical protein STRAU_4616 [Streptomyces aurantiacus JA 4570]|uniref:Uncharacterized protein n=1 Tax=Streptomyces aurantiacus JA 4570 TaxID=1286094 RepID=S4ALF9_9ACTN|nr:hypothetical protein STRAU_4616 [Streptomyces aurantiacus JA 4570]
MTISGPPARPSDGGGVSHAMTPATISGPSRCKSFECAGAHPDPRTRRPANGIRP